MLCLSSVYKNWSLLSQLLTFHCCLWNLGFVSCAQFEAVGFIPCVVRLCYATWIHWGAPRSNQSWRSTAKAKLLKGLSVAKQAHSSSAVRSCPSSFRELSVHRAGVAAGAVCGGQSQSGGRWHRLQRRDGLQDHGRRRARHVQHNNRRGHARGGHPFVEGTARTDRFYVVLLLR